MTLYKRDVEMNWITWIANTGQKLSVKRPKSSPGGLMGLCMGMSFVSVAEILYYMALR